MGSPSGGVSSGGGSENGGARERAEAQAQDFEDSPASGRSSTSESNQTGMTGSERTQEQAFNEAMDDERSNQAGDPEGGDTTSSYSGPNPDPRGPALDNGPDDRQDEDDKSATPSPGGLPDSDTTPNYAGPAPDPRGPALSDGEEDNKSTPPNPGGLPDSDTTPNYTGPVTDPRGPALTDDTEDTQTPAPTTPDPGGLPYSDTTPAPPPDPRGPTLDIGDYKETFFGGTTGAIPRTVPPGPIGGLVVGGAIIADFLSDKLFNETPEAPPTDGKAETAQEEPKYGGKTVEELEKIQEDLEAEDARKQEGIRKGATGDNTRQNQQVQDAANQVGLETPAERDKLTDEVESRTREQQDDLNYGDIVDIAEDIKDGKI